jgi:hypothetical protein
MVDVSGGIDQEVRSGIFYKDTQWSRHNVSIYLGFRAGKSNNLGDDIWWRGNISTDDTTFGACYNEYKSSAGLFCKANDSTVRDINVGFRA